MATGVWSRCHRDPPRGLVQIVGAAQQCDVGQAGRPLPGHGRRRRQRNGFGDQVGRDVLALPIQSRDRGVHLITVGLLCPDGHERDHRRIHRRQCHQRVPHGVVAHIDHQSRHFEVQQVGRDVCAQSRAPRFVGLGSPKRDDDFFHDPNLADADIPFLPPRSHWFPITSNTGGVVDSFSVGPLWFHGLAKPRTSPRSYTHTSITGCVGGAGVPTPQFRFGSRSGR